MIYGRVSEIGLNGVAVRPTNQRGELFGIYYAIKAIYDSQKNKEYLIVTDSEYAYKTIDIYYPNRVKKGTEKELANLDILEPTIKMRDELTAKNIKTCFLHVNSHRDKPITNNIVVSVLGGIYEQDLWLGNHIADEHATLALQMTTQEKYINYQAN
jgi:hypothetical protein